MEIFEGEGVSIFLDEEEDDEHPDIESGDPT